MAKRRQWIRRIAWSLLTGAVATIGIAWGTGLFGARWDDEFDFYYGLGDHVVVAWIDQAPFSDVVTWRYCGPRGEDWIRYDHRGDGPAWPSFFRGFSPEDAGQYVEAATGWPLRACATPRIPYNLIGSSDYLKWNTSQDRLRVLPFRPLPAGFVVDSIVWGSGIAAIWRIGCWLVTRFRLKPGHCASCRYDRRGIAATAACPECGAASAAIL